MSHSSLHQPRGKGTESTVTGYGCGCRSEGALGAYQRYGMGVDDIKGLMWGGMLDEEHLADGDRSIRHTRTCSCVTAAAAAALPQLHPAVAATAREATARRTGLVASIGPVAGKLNLIDHLCWFAESC